MCANPHCYFLVYPNEEFGGFCSKKYHWRLATAAKSKKHGDSCLQLLNISHEEALRAWKTPSGSGANAQVSIKGLVCFAMFDGTRQQLLQLCEHVDDAETLQQVLDQKLSKHEGIPNVHRTETKGLRRDIVSRKRPKAISNPTWIQVKTKSTTKDTKDVDKIMRIC